MADYEELVKALREADSLSMCGGCGYKGDKKGPLFAKAADAIEDLIAALTASNEVIAKSRDKWISVEGRLPDVKEEVIVCDKMPNGMRYVTTAFILEDCAFLNDCGRMYEVTHWMQLPEPPKEDGE